MTERPGTGYRRRSVTEARTVIGATHASPRGTVEDRLQKLGRYRGDARVAPGKAKHGYRGSGTICGRRDAPAGRLYNLIAT